jgi:hypothetical protein
MPRRVSAKVDFYINMWLTIASGNCNNIKRDIDGKMTSEVSGDEFVAEATANELNATSTSNRADENSWSRWQTWHLRGIPPHIV